jgi:hypothetical protein
VAQSKFLLQPADHGEEVLDLLRVELKESLVFWLLVFQTEAVGNASSLENGE